jgi:Carboxypeptidase regulatory-like domain
MGTPMAQRIAPLKNFLIRGLRQQRLRKLATWLLCLSLAALAYATPCFAQTTSQQPDSQSAGTITGRVIDQSEVPVAGARVKLQRDTQSQGAQLLTNDDGEFSFFNIAPGSFQLEITKEAFATQTSSGVLHTGETFNVPQIILAVATEATQVVVTPTQLEVAEDQIKEQEKQRVLGVIPNFYVTYVRDAAPLSPKQKFELAWKSTIDPVNFAITGVIAGVQHAQNDFSGYGQGAEGYARRYGAAFGGSVSSTFIGGAVLPSLLKQDPRYFYKGAGTGRSRVLYALANAVICKGDNGHWQANYSSILGSLAAGGIANLYYPAQDRNGFGLTVETALIGIGATAATNLLQEFVIRKFTPASSNPDPARQAPKIQNLIGKLFPKPLHEGDQDGALPIGKLTSR